MKKIAIIGSGPAAAGACLALRKKSFDVHLFDVGEELEEPNKSAFKRLGSSTPDKWKYKDIQRVTKNPSLSFFKKPQKLVFGSNYVYALKRSFSKFIRGQQPISPTFSKGGFSRAWGGAALPLSKNDLKYWPISYDKLIPHYREIWKNVPMSGINDRKYEEIYPRFGPYSGSLDLPRPCSTLLKLIQNDIGLSVNNNFHISQSRLMVSSGINGCINCGICISGCPYGHIFQGDAIIDSLVKEGMLKYHKYAFVDNLKAEKSFVKINILDTRTRKKTLKIFDKIFIAAGAIGTSGILLRSGLVENKITLLNSDKFILPLFLKGNPGKHHKDSPSLSSLFTSIKTPGQHNSWIHGQVSSVSSFLDLKWGKISPIMPWSLINRTLIMLGSLPSSLSSKTLITMQRDKTLKSTMIAKSDVNETLIKAIISFRSSILGKYVLIFPKFHRYLPAGGHHYGGQFPMTSNPSANQTDTLGRLKGVDNIHIIDSSVFPHIPSSTMVYTIMANAHRIVIKALK